MGIKPPILLGFHDKLDMEQGFDAETKQLNKVSVKTIVQLFADLKPDVVITWPLRRMDRASGPPAHRRCGYGGFCRDALG